MKSTKSDPRSRSVADEVVGRLRSCGHPALQYVQVSEESRTIVLEGTVPSFYLKQLAQTLAQTVDGVARVVNGTTVTPQRREAFVDAY